MPKDRTLRLIEIQESVLPEEEWLIGITDMTYFSGVGFSMPIPFESVYFEQNRDPMLGGHTGDISIEFDQMDVDSIVPAEPETEPSDSLLTSGLEQSGISLAATSFLESEGLHPNGIDEDRLVATLADGIEKPTLYAFLPGLFYSAVHESSVDAVLIEVTKKSLHGQDIASFRPEDVRSFDVGTGIVFNEDGNLDTVEMSMDIIGGFSADVTNEVSDSLSAHSNKSSLSTAIFDSELRVAEALASMIRLENLKKAYVVSSFLGGRLIRLLVDIEKNGLSPRFRAYVRNTKYPKGKVIEVRYRTIDSILDLDTRTGIRCPEEVDFDIDVGNLSFSRMTDGGSEVDVEESVLDLYSFIRSQVGAKIDLDRIVKLVFSEDGR
ncbi:MAG: hypothetical protein ACW99U_14850 [Candidatus Thorarchaeota archaeon]